MQKLSSLFHRRGVAGQLTVRGLLIGSLGSVVITLSSLYVALRMGALPWPTIFVAVMSLAILKLLKHTNINEVNVTHTAMSAGSMVAGGLAFTIPGIMILNPNALLNLKELLAVSLSGSILGIVFTALLRRYFIVELRLPFPMGLAASQTLLAGDEGGRKAWTLFSALGATALFTVVRDVWKKIPAIWQWSRVAPSEISPGIWVSPMAMAIGYLIGPLYTGVWFAGALLGYGGVVWIATHWHWLPNTQMALAFKNSLGIGLMVGTGLGILLKSLYPHLRTFFHPGKITTSLRLRPGLRRMLPLFLGIAVLPGIILHFSVLNSVLLILGVWLTTAMAGEITGQTGINPMEIFGILVLLALKWLGESQPLILFYTAGVVAVACGLTGDVMNDFKSGFILNTHPGAQLTSETVGGIVGAVVSVGGLLAMVHTFGTPGPGTALPAPQAYAVASMVQGIPHPLAFRVGLLLGMGLYLVRIPAMTLGIGVYLPLPISLAVVLGGAIALLAPKLSRGLFNREDGMLLASGMLGGEGITGVTIAIVKFLSMG